MEPILVIRVSRDIMQKARAGLVQKRVWIKDSNGRKGHSRMAWVRPDNDSAGKGKGQMSLFDQPVHSEVGSSGAMFLRAEGSKHREPVSSFQEASEKYSEMRDHEEREGRGGSSQMPSVFIVDANDKVIAHVSYNGRVWPGKSYQSGMKPLYDNRAKDAEDQSAILSNPDTETAPSNDYDAYTKADAYLKDMKGKPYKIMFDKDGKLTTDQAKAIYGLKEIPEGETADNLAMTFIHKPLSAIDISAYGMTRIYPNYDPTSRWNKYKPLLVRLDQEKGWPAATSIENIEKRKKLMALKEEMKIDLADKMFNHLMTDNEFDVEFESFSKKVEAALSGESGKKSVPGLSDTSKKLLEKEAGLKKMILEADADLTKFYQTPDAKSPEEYKTWVFDWVLNDGIIVKDAADAMRTYNESLTDDDLTRFVPQTGEYKPKSFQTGKKYRHKDGWEGEYLGTRTDDTTDWDAPKDKKGRPQHHLATVHGMKITKPSGDSSHFTRFTSEAWGEHSPEDFEEILDGKPEIKKTVARGFDTERHLKAYADSWEKLRKMDVYRILDEAANKKGGSAQNAEDMASAIVSKRPDLKDEVDESMDDLGFKVRVKKSVLDSFRAGLAKAFGPR